ncbi:hypothetical protein MOQ_007485 [Trypanosoma cruzi marinkellei]|uniref:Uncharacterized protein n=1 Tax=Trypanosoma cruzi marinkellei TaxID=85056 RepID=K2NIK7_TRYCR|nr:hypothetical protein MOQ_007485 [Trypanosoma cruzi marinkellei]
MKDATFITALRWATYFHMKVAGITGGWSGFNTFLMLPLQLLRLFDDSCCERHPRGGGGGGLLLCLFLCCLFVCTGGRVVELFIFVCLFLFLFVCLGAALQEKREKKEKRKKKNGSNKSQEIPRVGREGERETKERLKTPCRLIYLRALFSQNYVLPFNSPPHKSPTNPSCSLTFYVFVFFSLPRKQRVAAGPNFEIYSPRPTTHPATSYFIIYFIILFFISLFFFSSFFSFLFSPLCLCVCLLACRETKR